MSFLEFTCPTLIRTGAQIFVTWSLELEQHDRHGLKFV